MFIHYLIILIDFAVICLAANNRSSTIFIRHKLLSPPETSTTTQITTNNTHSDILSQWLRHSFSNKIIHIHKKLRARERLSNDIHNRNNTLPRKLLVRKENKTVDFNYERVRRNPLRGKTIDDENDINIYSNNDNNGRIFMNQQDDLTDRKQGFNEEYFLPMERNFKMRDNNQLYDDDIDRIRQAHNGNEDTRFMQNDEDFINSDRLSNDNHRQYFKMNHYGKNLADYNPMLKKQRNRYAKTYLDNEYFNQLENDE